MQTILFLHGWGGDEKSFTPILQYFKQHFNCLCPALPMFQSDSIKENPGAPWTLDDYADFVEEYLDKNDVEKCHIIAHSFGARVTALLLNKDPKRYGRIVLTGAAGIRKRSLCVWFKVRVYKLRKRVFKIKKQGGSSDYKKLTDAGKKTFQNIITFDLKNEIAKIIHPTLLIFGGKDSATPIKLGKKWQKLSKNSKLIIYKKSGHFCFIDEHARFIRDAYDFLNTTPTKTTL